MRVAVVGLGLIGGSLALAVGARGYDADPATRAKAREAGLVVDDDLTAALAGAEVVVAAVPREGLAGVLREASSSPAVLMDVASSALGMEEVERSLPAGARFVKTHPLAGSTHSGIDAATRDLFRDRPWIIVPGARSDAGAVAAVGELARAAGARPIVLSAAEHERAMRWLVRAPLLVASALFAAAENELGSRLTAELAGPGFTDTTRLAGTPDALIRELVADGADLAPALRTAAERLAAYADRLVSARDDLAAELERTGKARRQFERARSSDSSAK